MITAGVSLTYAYRDRLLQYYVNWKGDYKIVMYGDSMTSMGNWAELLHRTDVLNNGRPGHCTYHFRILLNDLVINKNPKICFIMGGINDITVGVSREKITANFTEVIESLKANNIIPVVTLTLYEQHDPVSMAEVQVLNRFLVDYCNKNRVRYIDMNSMLSDSTGLKSEFALDKTHLNTKAYKLWATEVDKVIKEMAI